MVVFFLLKGAIRTPRRACASFTLCSSRQGGWSTPRSSSNELNLCRSSARSISSGLVPSTLRHGRAAAWRGSGGSGLPH